MDLLLESKADLFSMDSPQSSISSRERFANSIEIISAPVTTYEPKGMILVRSMFEDVNETLDAFNNKVSDVLSTAEVDYMKAYHGHMKVIHQEITYLKSRLAEAEDSLQFDDQIQSLETDCNFYKTEGNRLETSVNSMKKKIVLAKEKHAVLKKEREMLLKKLKAYKKQEWLLCSDIEERETKVAMERRVEDIITSSSKPRRDINNQKLMTSEKRRLKKLGALSKNSKNLLSTTGGRSSDPGKRSGTPELPMLTVPWNLVTPHGENTSPLEMERDPAETEKDTALTKKEERALKKELSDCRSQTSKLRSLVVAHQTRRTDLEDFFLLCVEDVKKNEDRCQRQPATSKTLPNRIPELFGDISEEAMAVLFNELFKEA